MKPYFCFTSYLKSEYLSCHSLFNCIVYSMKKLSINVPENDQEYVILVGQNAQQNDFILRNSSPNDLWFHLDNVSSAFIILQCQGDPVPKRYLNYIGTLFRDYKNGLPSRYTVIYTEVKNVKLTNVMGTVIPSKTKVIKY